MMVEAAGKELQGGNSENRLEAVRSAVLVEDLTGDPSLDPGATMPDHGAALIKFSCHDCGARYALPAERIRGRVLTIRCKGCEALFEVQDRWSEPNSTVLTRGTKVWFVAVDKQHVGPMTAQEVCERWDRGELSGRTYAWRQGLPRWARLKDVPELSDKLGQPDSYDPADTAVVALGETYPLEPVTVEATSDEPDQTPPAEATPGVGRFEQAVPEPVEGATRSAGSALDTLPGLASDGEITAVVDPSADVWAEALGGTLPPVALVDNEVPTVVTEGAQPEAPVQPSGPTLLSTATTEYPAGFAETAIGDDPAEFAEANFVISPDGVSYGTPAGPAAAQAGWSEGEGEAEEARAELVLSRDVMTPEEHDLVGERNEDSVLFSLDHLIADAPAHDLMRWQQHRLPEDSLVLDPRARALIVPPPSAMVQTARQQQSRAGFGRLLLAAVLGAFLGAGTLLAAVYMVTGGRGDDLLGGLESSGNTADREAAARASRTPVIVPPVSQTRRAEAPLRTGANSLAAVEPAPRVMAPSNSEAPEKSASESAERTTAAEAKLVAPSPEDFAVKPVPSARPERRARARRARPVRRAYRDRPAALATASAAAPAAAAADEPRAASSSFPLVGLPDVDDVPAEPPLTPSQVGTGLAAARPALSACRGAYGQSIALTLAIVIDGASGRVKRGRVMPSFLDQNLRGCVVAAVTSTARFPRFEGAPMHVTRPLFLR